MQDEENVATVYSHGTIIWVKSSRSTRKSCKEHGHLAREPAWKLPASLGLRPLRLCKTNPQPEPRARNTKRPHEPKPSMKSRRINEMHSQTQRLRRRPKSRQNTRRAALGPTAERKTRQTNTRVATGYLRCPGGVHLVIILILSFTFVLPPSSLASAQAHMILSGSQGRCCLVLVSVCV